MSDLVRRFDDAPARRRDAIAEREDWLGRAQLAQMGFDESFARKVSQRMREGLDAVSTRVFQADGEIVLGPEQVDFTERRLAAELGAKLLDWMPNKLEHEVHGEVKFTAIGLSMEDV